MVGTLQTPLYTPVVVVAHAGEFTKYENDARSNVGTTDTAEQISAAVQLDPLPFVLDRTIPGFVRLNVGLHVGGLDLELGADLADPLEAGGGGGGVGAGGGVAGEE